MKLTRRQYLAALAAAPVTAGAAAGNGWTPEWDRAILLSAVQRADGSFDPAESMLKRTVGAEYRYHTNMRSTTVHPTRDSLEYALLLLEAGGVERKERAIRALERILALQETDPASKWYGIWGYYLEEPAPKMAPADWNWADFNGSLLLMIENRHGAALPEALRNAVRQAIHHAAYSVRRRNVSMTYTNIAVQGSFVVSAAAELLNDKDLRGYADDRLRRFAATVDETGSFAEYNSPTYANVTIENLTRMAQVLRDESTLRLAGRIHERAWLHLGKHWHVATRQLAPPMSRSYNTDIGAPVWIQKALGNRLSFAALEQLRKGEPPTSGEVALLNYRCPPPIALLFLEPGSPRQHREVFLPAPPPVTPVQGTTWLGKDFCLGSVNRGDFWIQRRPLLGFFGGASRPAHYVQFRFLKDDYDFTSALLYTAQERGQVLGAVNFRTPGGDKHPNLDPVPEGGFQATRMRLIAEINGAPDTVEILANGKRVQPGDGKLASSTRIAVDLGGAKLFFQSRVAVFGKEKPSVSIAREAGKLTISLDLLESPGLVRWQEAGEAYAVFTLAMHGANGSLSDFNSAMAKIAFGETHNGGISQSHWGPLALHAATAPAAISAQDRAYQGMLNGKPIPLMRLSDERLV
ncbi:MAG: hypothetical protein IT170_17155 [Bryobacterales bacterium]|nr:hypothetical protein [Bryobacterales bacterium]